MEIGFLVFGLAGLLTLVCFMPPLAGRLKLPYSVLLALVGCALGYVVHVHDWAPRVVADFLDSIEHFEISSETFLIVFLPVLLFETALAMNVRRLLDEIGPILMMAIVAVLVCTLVVGYTLAWVSDYGLVVCLLLGAIVATTDPVAVVGIFREVGAPRRLTTLVEGESLFNDAASIALYSVLLAVLGGQGELSALAIGQDFLVQFLGGGLAGLAMGRLAGQLFGWLRGWPVAEITLTLTLAYLTFFISEHYLGVSGVVATVIAGLVVGSSGRTRMSPTTFEHLASAWAQFGFWANSLIFLFAAMLVPRLMADTSLFDFLMIGVVFAATLAARALVVFGLLPLLGVVRIGQRVGRRYQAVMCWGGLRGAVSLALALAVTEHQAVDPDARNFIAVVVTGFVLATLFVSGTTLRTLIRMLGLNALSPVERTLRNQALTVALEDLQERTGQIAQEDHISPAAQQRVAAVFDASLSAVHESPVSRLDEDQQVKVGLSMMAAREEEMFFGILKAQIVDWRLAERLLARAQAMGEAVRANGEQGFEAAIVHDLRYSRGFRLALELHDRLGLRRWLAQELAQRFSSLMSKRSVAQRLMDFARHQVQPLLGKAATDRILALHAHRLALIQDALSAMALQYPGYAEWLQEAYLGRVARELERSRYRDMLEQSLISGEVYADLMMQLQARWRYIDRSPELDIGMTAGELIARVPLFAGLAPQARQAIEGLLKPRLALPEQPVTVRNRQGAMMCFVASGAVKIGLPDGTGLELGSGEFFGEMALLSGETVVTTATSLGYSRLLMLSARDFRALLERDADLRKRIERVAQERLRALQVWRRHQAALQAHPGENGGEAGRQSGVTPTT
ncbi:cation:proton antiporter [Orrella sp. JC864]|uniref:cation:proton antiporter n=1 Tax=Orrella sp. JC864 TaxID=3120298 RepID=UPI0030097CDE